MSADVQTLRTRLEAYEHREGQWKLQLQQQHAQVQALQQKLTQAGTHLKALATENAKLHAQQQQQPSVDDSRLKELQQQLEQQQTSHQASLEAMIRDLSLHDAQQNAPNPADMDQVQRYVHSVTAKLASKANEQDTTIQALRSQVTQLEQQLKEQPAPAPAALNGSSASDASDATAYVSLEQTLQGLMSNVDDYVVDASLYPPQLLGALEDLRTMLQANASQPAAAPQDDHHDEIKELKRQVTQLQMTVNEVQDEKATIEQQQEDSKDEVAGLQQQLDELTAQHEQALRNAKHALELEVHDAKVALEDKERDAAEAQERNHQLLQQLDELHAQHESMSRDRDELHAKLSAAEAKTSALEEKCAQMTDDGELATQHAAQLQQLEDKVQQLEKQVEEEQSKYASADAERVAAQEHVERLQREHQALLDRIGHLKDTLAPRLEQDKQLRHRVAELTTELEQAKANVDEMRATLVAREQAAAQQLDTNEKHLTQLQRRVETLQGERDELEMHAMDLDARSHQIQQEYEATLAELTRCKKQMEIDMESSASERASLLNLQSVLEEFQAGKDAEVQAAVEHMERQLDLAKKSWAEYEERARIAETKLDQFQQDMAKTQQYEQEIKEKTLLIGKLRHEAIILNEHLVEAMRRLKEETSENNVDRQLVTNLVVGFFNAPRGDRKRFDILSIIANVLQMNEEQKEQVGLIRAKPNGARSPGYQNQTKEEEPRESFTDAWISFLLKESSQRRHQRQEKQPASPN
ncbi:hypothetical protein BC940DRAFT_261691 [Gongronella butleri]|nr:hypothetical protein BC940DRAFT_261691 [Gongronella butleri]